MRIWMQKSASMQRRTNRLKFGDLAEKSDLNSVSNLSTKVCGLRRRDAGRAFGAGCHCWLGGRISGVRLSECRGGRHWLRYVRGAVCRCFGF